MVEKLKEYFLENVTLAQEFKNILADFLGDEATDYTIETIPIEPVLKQYVDGSYLGQLTFQFGSREYYDNSDTQNIENLDFYERFQQEIEYNNKNHILPDIDGIQSIECLSNGTIQDIENKTAKYVIQMRITYLKEV
jgi:hypothetical protein